MALASNVSSLLNRRSAKYQMFDVHETKYSHFIFTNVQRYLDILTITESNRIASLSRLKDTRSSRQHVFTIFMMGKHVSINIKIYDVDKVISFLQIDRSLYPKIMSIFYCDKSARNKIQMNANDLKSKKYHAGFRHDQSNMIANKRRYGPKSLSNLKMYFLLLRAWDGQMNVFDDIVCLLPKFKTMDINTLWLSPPQPQTAAAPPMFVLNDHGYWPSDHGTIDPVLGGQIAFERLVKEAYRYGIEIAIDVVLNHYGYTDEVILNGKNISTSDPNYFIVLSHKQSAYAHHAELNWKMDESLNVDELFHYREELSRYPLFDLPTMQKDNSEIRTYLFDSYKKFIDMQINIFRIDAAKHMPADFLIDFADEMNRYSLLRWNRPMKFLWEVYLCNSHALSKFIQGTLASLKDASGTFFYDFPMREEFKRILNPDYKFEWLSNFVQYRERTQQYLNRLIPLVEDHDNGLPISNPSLALMIYALTEYYSRNSTFIYHGSEQTGVRTVNRPRIQTINEFGDIATLVNKLGQRIMPYRISQDTRTLFHVTEHDILVSEKQLNNERSLFLAMNKSSFPRTIDLSVEHLCGTNRILTDKIWEAEGSRAKLLLSQKTLRLTISSFSFLIIETHILQQ